MSELHQHVVMVAAAAVFLGILSLLPPCGVSASEYTPDDQLRLARVCASEVGLRSTPECAAIHAVLADRADRMGVPYRVAVCAYSTMTCTRSRRDARRWIAWLRPDGRRPRGWPQRASWARQRAAWLDLYRYAGEVLRGEVEPPCRGPVHHWGMTSGEDMRRATMAGWERVECPGARNAFWRVPRWVG